MVNIHPILRATLACQNCVCTRALHGAQNHPAEPFHLLDPRLDEGPSRDHRARHESNRVDRVGRRGKRARSHDEAYLLTYQDIMCDCTKENLARCPIILRQKCIISGIPESGHLSKPTFWVVALRVIPVERIEDNLNRSCATKSRVAVPPTILVNFIDSC